MTPLRRAYELSFADGSEGELEYPDQIVADNPVVVPQLQIEVFGLVWYPRSDLQQLVPFWIQAADHRGLHLVARELGDDIGINICLNEVYRDDAFRAVHLNG